MGRVDGNEARMNAPRDASCSQASPAGDVHELRVAREAMACLFEVVFNAGESASATSWGIEALDLVEQLEARLTVYRESSELIHLNARAARTACRVAPDLFSLLLRGRQLYEQTDGAVDVASGRLVRAWGFLARQGRTPSADVLAVAREHSGMQHVELDESSGCVRFNRSGLELNLGSIGKGWAIDRAIELLFRRGATNVLVHGGHSSVRAAGQRGAARAEGWPVGLRHPLVPGRRLATFWLRDEALGTSGSGTQFFVERGRRLGHILDPRSGLPAEGVLSATVMAPNAADADALATALYVLGEEGLDRIVTTENRNRAVIVLPGRQSGQIRIIRAGFRGHPCHFEAGHGVDIVDQS
jgi:thiamine biosynthesis lipoprotein